MIKVEENNIEISGTFKLVIAELMNVNLEFVKFTSNKELEAGEIDRKDLKDTQIKLLNKILNSCIMYIEEENNNKEQK